MKNVVTIKLSLPWWASGYAYMCSVFAALHGLEPDTEKIVATVKRHLKVEVS